MLDRVGLVHAHAVGREKRYQVDDAQFARAVAQLAAVGAAWDARLQPHQADRRGDPALPGRGNPDTRKEVGQWWTSCTASASRRRPPTEVYEALTTVDGLAGWWTDQTTATREVGGAIEFRFVPGGFDMEVVELEPAKRVHWQVVDGPPEWVGTHVTLRPVRGRRLHDRAVQARGLGGAGRVHAPLQHQVGVVPDEPQAAARDRHRRSCPA